MTAKKRKRQVRVHLAGGGAMTRDEALQKLAALLNNSYWPIGAETADQLVRLLKILVRD